jgi:glucokinase
MVVHLGIDLGGTFIKIGLVDDRYSIINKISIPTQSEHPFESVVQDIALTCLSFLKESNVQLRELESVGIAVPSIVDPHNKHIVYANNLNWKDVDLLGELKKYLDVPIYIADDADCAALGEVLAGSARGIKEALMITLGTGVGGGFIMGGKIYKGGDGYGCEPGHTILQMNGEACTCGRKGCLEAYTSITALIRDAKRAINRNPTSLILKMVDDNLDKIDGRIIFEAADQKDSVASEVVDQYLNYLAEGIASLHNALRPQVIIIGGGISSRKERLIEPLKLKLKDLVFAADYLGLPNIVTAELGNDAGIVGAAFLHQGL